MRRARPFALAAELLAQASSRERPGADNANLSKMEDGFDVPSLTTVLRLAIALRRKVKRAGVRFPLSC